MTDELKATTPAGGRARPANFLEKIGILAEAADKAELDRDDVAWFNELKNQFEALDATAEDPDPVKKRAREELRKIIAGGPGDRIGKDLANLETWLIEALPLEDLRQKVASLRDDCRDLVSPASWERLQATQVSPLATADEKSLRAEARRLQQELHWCTSFEPEAHNLRVKLMLNVGASFLVCLVVVGVLSWLSSLSFTAVIVLAGVLGALVSCVQRIQSADLTGSRADSLPKRNWLAISLVISPVLGGIFSIIMVLLLVAGQVSPGFVVPDVKVLTYGWPVKSDATHPPSGADGETHPMPGPGAITAAVTGTNAALTNAAPVADTAAARTYTPEEREAWAKTSNYYFFTLKLRFKTGQDLALLILWSFMAGFFERLVPDLLTRLASAKKS